MKTVIHWFRRDLRVSDNVALSEAAKRAENIIPVFIFENAFRTGPDVGAARLAFLLQSVESLRKNLAELGHTLVVRGGKSEEILPRLCIETGAQAVFANKRYEPYTQKRDERITAALSRRRGLGGNGNSHAAGQTLHGVHAVFQGMEGKNNFAAASEAGRSKVQSPKSKVGWPAANAG